MTYPDTFEQPAPGADPHLFSVDVEEHFQVSAFEPYMPRDQWSRQPSRVVANVRRLLDLLDEFGARGTFFVLGWVAERQPELVREIARRGHEIASHGWSHRRVTTLAIPEFRDEVRRSRALLEEISGTPVVGYRAPSFSILTGMAWAYDVLLEEGYRYDSSRFPIRRKGYGSPDVPVSPFFVRRPAGEMLELPLATTTMWGVRLPAAGGGYFRQLPYALTARALREHGGRGQPAMFYIHPWEYDVDQPRLDVSWLTARRHYGGLARTWPRLRRLLAEFRFTSVAERLPDLAGLALPA